jgi:hypothetical protein
MQRFTILTKVVLKKIIPEHMAILKEVSEYTARFMELILAEQVLWVQSIKVTNLQQALHLKAI